MILLLILAPQLANYLVHLSSPPNRLIFVCINSVLVIYCLLLSFFSQLCYFKLDSLLLMYFFVIVIDIFLLIYIFFTIFLLTFQILSTYLFI